MARMVRIEQTGYDEQAEQAQRREPEPQPEQAQHMPQKPQIIERDLGKEVKIFIQYLFCLISLIGSRANYSCSSKTNGTHRIGTSCS